MSAESTTGGSAVYLTYEVDPSHSKPGTASATATWQAVTSATNAVAIDATAGDNVYHVLTEDTTIGNPTDARDGQVMRFLFLNDGNNRVVSWDTKYKIVGGALTITVGAKSSLVCFKYNETADLWFEVSRSLNMG